MNLDKQTRLSIALIEATAANLGEVLARVTASAIALAGSKDAASSAREGGKDTAENLWSDVLQVARHVQENAGEVAPETQKVVFAQVLLDALAGNDAAIKTVKSYTSTAKKAITAVNAGTVKGWPVLEAKATDNGDEPVTYAECRDLLKSASQKELDGLKKDIAKMVSEVCDRENSTRAAVTRKAELEQILELIRPIRDNAVREVDANKPKSKAAKAASDLQQQQPSAPMVTETVKAEVIAA